MTLATFLLVPVLGVASVGDSTTSRAAPTRPGDAAVRAAVERGLPRLAERTGAWIDAHGCASCHQVPFALWALNGARDAGFEVDARTPGWNRWAIETTLAARTRGDEVWELLLAGSVRDAEDPEAARAALVALRRETREADGGWEAGGQLPDQRRPLPEIHDTSSAWTRRALAAGGAQVAGTARVAVSASVEHLGLRLLESGDPERRVEFLAAQDEDGGWPWLRGEASDALGTGLALYVLAESRGARADDVELEAAIARARAFLVRAQDEHGGWSAPSTLAKHARAATEVSGDWGTAWALIALVRTLEARALPAGD